MLNEFSRTELLIGHDSIEKLNNSKVAIFGLGGVGSFVLEGLVRAGIGNFVLVDHDKISITNINRQLLATQSSIDKYKVDVAKARILDINPNANVEIYREFFMPETQGIIDNTISYVVDAIDTVTAKIEIVMRSQKLNIPIICSMGTGNKLDPSKFQITDIYKTSVCPLAKVMRKELRVRGIKDLKVLYSTEEPIKVINYDEYINDEKSNNSENVTNKKQVPGSVSFVPSVAGLMIAGEVIRDIIRK